MRSWWCSGALVAALVAGCSGASFDPIEGRPGDRAEHAGPEPAAEGAATPSVETPPASAAAEPPANGAAPASPAGAAAPRKRVFVTSEEFGARLESPAGADRRCQDAADRAALGGQWRAWLSGAERKALDAVAGDGPWYLVDRKTVAFPDRRSLTRGPAHAIDMDETGKTLTRARTGFVWTGTERDGTGADGRSCGNWTNDSPLAEGAVGVAFARDEDWTWARTRGCFLTRASLYCFEQ